MNGQAVMWLCVAITFTIFIIEWILVKKLKNKVIEQIEWEK
jgi:hypothetical protein